MRSTTSPTSRRSASSTTPRDMAVVRGHLAGFPVVLSSATPSHRIAASMPSRPLHAHRAADRHGGAALPEIDGDRPAARRRRSAAASCRRRWSTAIARDAGAKRAGAALPQPPRLCAADALPHLRPPLPVPELLDLAGRAPLPRRAALPPLRPFGAAAGSLPGLRRRGEPGRPSARASSGWPRRWPRASPRRARIVMSSDTCRRASTRLRLRAGVDRQGRGRHRHRHAARRQGPQFPLPDAGRRGRCRSRPGARRPARGRAHVPAPDAR